MQHLIAGRAESASREPRHDEASSAGVVGVQRHSVDELGHKVLGASSADGFSVDDDVANKEVLVGLLALQHLQNVLHVDVDVSITFEDEPAGAQTQRSMKTGSKKTESRKTGSMKTESKKTESKKTGSKETGSMETGSRASVLLTPT